MTNGMYELTILPKDCKGVGCKWMFRIMRDALDQIVRLKVKLVAKEYS